MWFSPIHYDEPLFRPPSEANSLIVQVTLGCSWNKCRFCEMYSTKKFRVRPGIDVFHDIEAGAEIYRDVRKIFLADGDAMVLPYSDLMKILEKINSLYPRLQRVSAYAMPGNILSKTQEELRALAGAGLSLIYVGIESGDDELLKRVNKGETAASTRDGLIRAHDAGMKSSVMILTGLGGKKFSEQHAVRSAQILNDVKPWYASTLVLSFPFGVHHYRKKFGDDYMEMNTDELLAELELFIHYTELETTIFRSDHASNYLALKGILGRDKNRFLDEIRFARNNPDMLRKEWMRGL